MRVQCDGQPVTNAAGALVFWTGNSAMHAVVEMLWEARDRSPQYRFLTDKAHEARVVPREDEHAKIAVLSASLVAAVLGAILLLWRGRVHAAREEPAGTE